MPARGSSIYACRGRLNHASMPYTSGNLFRLREHVLVVRDRQEGGAPRAARVRGHSPEHKCRVCSNVAVNIPLSELEEMRAAEARHFRMLSEVLVSLGRIPRRRARAPTRAGWPAWGCSSSRTRARRWPNTWKGAHGRAHAQCRLPLLIQLAEQSGRTTPSQCSRCARRRTTSPLAGHRGQAKAAPPGASY